MAQITLNSSGVASNGTLKLQSNGTTDAVTIDTAQNLGLGVTPSGNFLLEAGTTTAAGRSFKLMTLTGGFSGGNYPFFGYNFRSTTTSGTYRYDGNDAASAINFSGGIAFNVAASGTAGNAITWNQAMTLDASGNLLVGGTTATNSASGRGNIVINGSSTAMLNLTVGNAQKGYFYHGGTDCIINNSANGAMLFYTNDTERARIDSSGNLLVGKTVTTSTTTGISFAPAGQTIVTSNGSVDAIVGYRKDSTAGNNIYAGYSDVGSTLSFRFAVINNGGIQNYSANNTNLSDERVKTNIVLAGDYLAKICAIPVKTFNYKDEPEGEQASLGVIAQDVEAVAPELVNTDGFGETPEDGIPLKAIYQTDLQYALMKSIQELNAKVDAQAAEIAALKGQA